MWARFVAVDEEMIASTVKVLQTRLCSKARKNAIVNNTNPIAKNICFFHGMSCKNHSSVSVLFAVLKDVPKLPPSLRVKTSSWLIKENDFWVWDKAYSNWESSSHAERQFLSLCISVINQLHILESSRHHSCLIFWLDTFNSCIEEKMLLNSQNVPKNIKLWANPYLKLDKLKLTLQTVTTNPSISTCHWIHAS